eukprot:Skav210607  [mRNA]  locus=scaffold234:108721:112866:+ [translate_table: standard]
MVGCRGPSGSSTRGSPKAHPGPEEQQLDVLKNVLAWHGRLADLAVTNDGAGLVQYQLPAKPGDLIVEEFPITFEGYTYKYGRIAYIKGRGPRPVILVHHNYCGLKQFDVDQACFVARAGYVGLTVDLYQETASFTCYDRARASGRPVDRQGFMAVARAENLMQRDPPEQELNLFFDAMPKNSEGKAQKLIPEGKVDFQLVRNFVGGFVQMRRVLCNPAGWRDMMKAYLEQLD